MSKALEAAWKAFSDACAAEAKDTFMRMDSGEPLSSIKHRPTAPLEAAISAYLAHLAEDEELRDRIKQVVAEGLYYGLPQVDPKLVSETLAGDIADVIVRTLAGKE